MEALDEPADLHAEDALQGQLSGATTVTSSRRARSDAATSRPMKLEPITTAFAGRARDDGALSGERPQAEHVRQAGPVDGKRGVAPVASRSAPGRRSRGRCGGSPYARGSTGSRRRR